ncbi:hypothetical protein OIU84_003215 [Salix udensis]|uniref:Uncharacterized protein n=1 Tax=Salix udensis TaxID=889485 RepID=A0AAD6K5R8_9ROSI|nr:hypothetical protein OIU84_003215 [Salix udensis]
MAISMSRNLHNPTRGWPVLSPSGLDEAAQRCLYTSISEQIHTSMESLRSLSKKLSGAKSLNSGQVEEVVDPQSILLEVYWRVNDCDGSNFLWLLYGVYPQGR